MAIYQIALENTLRWEDSTLSGTITTDSGGLTRFGISKNAHPEVFPEIVECSRERALELAGRVMRGYWRFDGLNDQDVANKIFDIAVNMGLATAIRMAQKCTYLVEVDGLWGPKTEAAVNSASPALLSVLRRAHVDHYEQLVARNPEKYERYINGWRTRALA